MYASSMEEREGVGVDSPPPLPGYLTPNTSVRTMLPFTAKPQRLNESRTKITDRLQKCNSEMVPAECVRNIITLVAEKGRK